VQELVQLTEVAIFQIELVFDSVDQEKTCGRIKKKLLML